MLSICFTFIDIRYCINDIVMADNIKRQFLLLSLDRIKSGIIVSKINYDFISIEYD